jgi:hypothetical protein
VSNDGHGSVLIVEGSQQGGSIVRDGEGRAGVPQEFEGLFGKIFVQLFLEANRIQEVLRRRQTGQLFEELVLIAEALEGLEVREGDGCKGRRSAIYMFPDQIKNKQTGAKEEFWHVPRQPQCPSPRHVRYSEYFCGRICKGVRSPSVGGTRRGEQKGAKRAHSSLRTVHWVCIGIFGGYATGRLTIADKRALRGAVVSVRLSGAVLLEAHR